MGTTRQQQVISTAWTEPKLVPHRPGVASLMVEGPQIGPPAAHLPVLSHTLETQVIPRLVLSHRAAAAASLVNPAVESDVLALSSLVLKDDGEQALAYVNGLVARGTTLDEVYLDLLSPAAQHLGELWEQDLCDFADVTLGLWRLHQVLRELGPAFQQGAAPHDSTHQALLVPLPGAQHNFGLLMVADFFRRAGWNVCSEPAVTRADLFAMVRRRWFGMIGLSMACEAQIDELASCIRGVRRASRNPVIGVMVGGPIFVEHPEYVTLVGADATAKDGRQAVLQAQGLLALLANRG